MYVWTGVWCMCLCDFFYVQEGGGRLYLYQVVCVYECMDACMYVCPYFQVQTWGGR